VHPASVPAWCSWHGDDVEALHAAATGGAMAATVLVVEDERKLRDFIRSYLERAGLTVLSTGSGAEAITMAANSEPDLVILDLGLPDVSGETVARELRAMSAIPILMLTAKAAEEDRIRGLELGADDYVTKPFSPRELVLRVQAILRRGGPDAAQKGVASYGGGALVIDEPRRTATVRGTPVQLTPTEWGILITLATVPGRVYSRFELINKVRGYEFEGYERTVDSHVKNLRRKIEEDPGNPDIIVTVLGGGYRLGLVRDD
jgi:DNA-binding response OmpR family regulator